MSVQEIENMSIKEKRMAALVMEGKDEEVALAQKAEQLAVVEEEEEDEGVEMEDEVREEEVIKVADTSGGVVKVRKDYVPKSKRQPKVPMSLCQICGQQVPDAEFAEHVRIELLDPRWKEKKAALEAHRSAANLATAGTDVTKNLREFAAVRTDLFSTTAEEEAKRQEAEAKAKQREREKVVWDGHAATRDAVTERFQTGVNLQEQIEALHKAKGLVPTEDTGLPKIGPALPGQPQILDPSAPMPPPLLASSGASSGATMFAAPQPMAAPPSMSGQGMQPAPIHLGGMGFPTLPPQAQAQMQYPTVPHGLPARPPVLNPGEGMQGPPPQTLPPISFANYSGLGVRPAEGPPDDGPQVKRMKVMKLPPGQFYPESDWLTMNPDPVSIVINLPSYPEKPEWGCNGSAIVLDDVPLNLMAGSLRDRIMHKTGCPVAKQRLLYGGKILSTGITLASLNIDDGDIITLQLKQK
ncbi:hypothetical protein BT69DRAFT_1089475 [Atractiella rhizophila]|nr:hypothetical protein BT69DRAFT_1089475 [Atractiella rhizophila]